MVQLTDISGTFLALVLFLSVNARGFIIVPQKPSIRKLPSDLKALPKEELLRLTREYMSSPSPDWWDDEYVFRGPVIGPLVKKDLILTLKGVGSNTEEAFPDFEPNAFGFTADDPIEPNRVWFFVRPRGTFAKPFTHPVVGKIEPTGEKLIAPPEARSVTWTDEGKILTQTVGYVTDRFTGDTTGGKGAIFRLYAHMGQDIDATPGSFLTGFLQWIATVLLEGTIPRSYSKEEDIPAWWTDKRRGSEA